jgi:hypothetical protein
MKLMTQIKPYHMNWSMSIHHIDETQFHEWNHDVDENDNINNEK